MARQQRYDAIVIGAGVIGAAVGFELAKAGYRTLNVDKLSAAGYGSTGNSCAIIRTHYSTWAGVAMAYEGLFYWRDWAAYLDVDDELGFARYVECGGVYLGDPARYSEKVLPLFDEIGVPYEVWDVATLRDRIPGIDTGVHAPPKRADHAEFFADPKEQLASAVYSPAAGYITDPQLATHNLQRATEARGGQFRFNAEVAAVPSEAGRVTGVQLADGSFIAAPIVVNVAGPHSFVINEMAGVADSMGIKTRALRHEVHHVPAPDRLDFGEDGYLVGDDDLGTYFRPEVDGHLLLGSQDPDCDPQEWVTDPDDFDRQVSNDQWHTQVLRLARRLPELGIPHFKKGIVDLYDVSDDWIPIYDRTDLDGFYVAVGSSGNQFKNAPVAGYCMAELIRRVEAGHDHDADPIRVRQRHTGLELNLVAYSRNRAVNLDSSFSVLG